MFEHLRVDRLGGTAEREFAQRRQVRFGEKMREGSGRLLREVHFPRLQPLDQFVGRDVDDFDLGGLDDAVGDGFADTHARERGDDVVEALDVLDVDRRIDVDARREQFLDVLIAFGVAAAGRVGMGEFVDEHERRRAFEDGV